MKILEIDYDFYYYPQGISSIDDFIDYANSNYNSFVKLIQLKTENCAFPYFIKEDTKEIYVNIAAIDKISEEDATVLCRLDYDVQLEQVVKKKCIDCAHYEEESEGDNLKGHREKINLDGECFWYEKREG